MSLADVEAPPAKRNDDDDNDDVDEDRSLVSLGRAYLPKRDGFIDATERADRPGRTGRLLRLVA